MVLLMSWNVDDKRDDDFLGELLRLIAEMRPEIICLQEVPERFLEALASAPISAQYPNFTFAIDQHKDGGYLGPSCPRTTSYLVILSKREHPFEEVFEYTHGRPKETLFSEATGWDECIQHHGVNIKINGKSLRIINVHFGCAATYRDKRKQFRVVTKEHFIPDHTIVCGDFNTTITLEPRHLLLHLVGRWFSARDILQARAQRHFAKAAGKHGLQDLFCNTETYIGTGLSLVGILIPKRLVDKIEYWALSETRGSDHAPTFARLPDEI